MARPAEKRKVSRITQFRLGVKCVDLKVQLGRQTRLLESTAWVSNALYVSPSFGPSSERLKSVVIATVSNGGVKHAISLRK